MDIEIVAEKDNPLLSRKEYTGIVKHLAGPTPKRLEIRDKAAAMVNADSARTVVIKLESEFGLGRSKMSFRVYTTPEEMMRIEMKYMLKRNGFLSAEEKKDTKE